MSAHTINRPVPRVLAMSVSPRLPGHLTPQRRTRRARRSGVPGDGPRQIGRRRYNAHLRHFGAKPAGPATVEPDTKHIIRQWNREIEDEARRHAAPGKDD